MRGVEALRTAAVVACVAAAVGLGCGTRTVETELVDEPNLQVSLRHEVSGGVRSERGFQHPATISRQRMLHILGALDIETREPGKPRQRIAAIHPELLDPIARALVDALEKADSTQDVALLAVRKEGRLGIFHRKRLTTLTAYARDDRLYVFLSRVEWQIPKEREGKNLPEPARDERQMDFRAVPGPKMSQAGAQGIAIRWRDPLFSTPVRVAGEDGERERRTILMESPIPADELDDEDAPTIDGITPEVLRALADLEEARRSGTITETEYLQRRETLLGEDGF